MINIAVLGYGTVGSGVVEIIRTNQDIINGKSGQDINLKYVLDLRDFPGDPVEKILVHDYKEILDDEDVQIVVEVMGGVNPAYSFVKDALLAGKSVCTSNKELVAKHGAELIAIAKEKNINFFFEASVGGGIPIIRPLNECITADEILEISGILNGTTNYILTKMEKEGLEFASVLKEAQDLGFAERNPEADVEGYDAGRKVAILSSLACEKQVDFEDIYTEGITKITDTDFKYAAKLGVSIKLIGSSKKVGDKYCAMVTPKMLPYAHPLAGVNGVMNAIFVKGNVLGDVMFYGAGAGKLPTASAVVSDIVAAARHINENVETKWDAAKADLIDVSDSVTRFFVRISGNESDRLDAVNAAFGQCELVKADGVTGEFAVVTPAISEGEYTKAAAALEGIISKIRIEK